MKGVRQRAEFPWIPADFIQADQTVEAIKRRVLGALGHDRPGQLLKSPNEFTFGLPGVRQQQNILDQPPHVERNAGPAAKRIGKGLADNRPIPGADFAGVGPDIGPVDRKTRDDFRQSDPDIILTRGSSPRVSAAAVLQKTFQVGQFAVEEKLQDQKLFFMHDCPVVG